MTDTLTEEQVHAIFTERQKREDKKIDKLLEVIESLKAEVSASKASKPEEQTATLMQRNWRNRRLSQQGF
jgi:hypothetical protein